MVGVVREVDYHPVVIGGNISNCLTGWVAADLGEQLTTYLVSSGTACLWACHGVPFLVTTSSGGRPPGAMA